MALEQDSQMLRQEILAHMPDGVLQPQPQRLVMFVLYVSLVIIGAWLIIVAALPWFIMLLIAVILGNCYASMQFFAHDVLHGSVVRSRLLQNIIGYIGCSPFLITPKFWKAWHNSAHHGNTNNPYLDPDAFKTLKRYGELSKTPLPRYLLRMQPGSRHWLSIISLVFGFTLEAQYALWRHAKQQPQVYSKLNRRQAIVGSFILMTLWLAFGIAIGIEAAFFIILLPMVIGNIILMSYIMTNHLLRPATAAHQLDDSLNNSMSVTTLALLDKLHLNFSHHVEHHIFPDMSSRYTPLVRNYLRQHMTNTYLAPPHWKALWWVYHTPHVYRDEHTLINPDSGHTVTTEEIESYLRRPEKLLFSRRLSVK